MAKDTDEQPDEKTYRVGSGSTGASVLMELGVHHPPGMWIFFQPGNSPILLLLGFYRGFLM